MIESGPQLVLFPTVGTQHPETGLWSADIHGWCFDTDESRHFQRTTAGLLRHKLKISRHEPDPPMFRERALGFVVDNRKKVPVEVLQGETPLICLLTKRNGHCRGEISLELTRTADVETTAHGSLKTSVRARRVDTVQNVPAPLTTGTVHLPTPTGLSIISDIDDTIKFSNVSNKQELLLNTFLRSFRCIEGMPELFQSLASKDVCFHYISATPWQMFLSVERFLKEQGFPEGSIHLRKFALKDATILKKIFPAHKKKRKVIEDLITQFPERRFLLIGDTGEKDPEIYGDIARRFPRQVIGICVRNISPDPPHAPRFQRAFAQISQKKWIVYEDALRLQERFLSEVLPLHSAEVLPAIPHPSPGRVTA